MTPEDLLCFARLGGGAREDEVSERVSRVSRDPIRVRACAPSSADAISYMT